MKKLAFFAIATALVLGMSQCKKEQPQSQQEPEGEKVTITLDVSGGGNAGRSEWVHVDTELGQVSFEQDDVIYVGSGGKYVGKLKHDGNQFVGNINVDFLAVNQKLWFYFLGNKETEYLTAGTTTTCTVDISDQTSVKLPVISMSESNEPYTVGRTNFTAQLHNMCALVKFEVDSESQSPTLINVVNDKVIVNFGNNDITYDAADGKIQVQGGTGERWAIILPQTEQPKETTMDLDGKYVGIQYDMPIINSGYYISDPIRIALQRDLRFSVSQTKKVFSAPGNLLYQPSTGTWRFAEHPTDWSGTGNQGTVSEGGEICDNARYDDPSYTGWIDVFSYGTGDDPLNCNGNSTFVDWGVNMDPDNPEKWFTLSSDEWNYLFRTRPGAADLFGVCSDGNVIVLPDNFELPSGCNFHPMSSEFTNTYSPEQWEAMKANGAVILMFGGGIRPYCDAGLDLTINGVYWTNDDPYIDEGNVFLLLGEDLQFFGMDKKSGCRVRLAREW